MYYNFMSYLIIFYLFAIILHLGKAPYLSLSNVLNFLSLPSYASTICDYPSIPSNPESLAKLISFLERSLLDPSISTSKLSRLAHKHQVLYRLLSKDEIKSVKVLNLLEERWKPVANSHIKARQAFIKMKKNKLPSLLPAWRIIEPEPAENLLNYYKKAEKLTGIEWEILAAINLVETGMGRIDGVSVANAQGPMQFLPSTWMESGIGEGNILDPHDSIQAAARYLVRRGGLKNIREGLWGYNNSDEYGLAVLEYAKILKNEPNAFLGLYHWQIQIDSSGGDIWLPVGYSQSFPLSVSDYLAEYPCSLPAS